ncbi:hypothetical protein SAMD00019534_063400 [Acytostelium subglobosum LB1]|uniref:hypothetical protein n=1 Tax=Acytostelium subglobosum LB1 TaxID=1410327 RepID=UPI000644B696|nr:hypothetical protein SAMD00019534_063400 [Acytostelium subglobosum LB1]GAM23165.1 hypothetical protein SAMD00019534_063400 [Acytostelium subglobosum LB1]|eukprot:XP_012753614.1 hypothetical protein SAMD00019534_063400 [Acytostelium subglobosum LB1]
MDNLANPYLVADEAFVVSLITNVVISSLIFFVFIFLRPKYKELYQYRYEHQHHGIDTPPSSSLFGWVLSTLRFSNEKIIASSGLDAYCYLRNVRSSFYIMLLMAILTAIGLYPTNYMGKFNETRAPDESKVVGLSTISMTNIAQGEKTLWVHVFFTFLTTLVVCYFIFYDYKDYSNRRIQFKNQDRLMNYSIYVKDIPNHLFTQEDFFSHMDHLFPGQIKEVALIVQTTAVYKKIEEREGYVKLYDHIAEREKRTNKTEYVRDGFLGRFGNRRNALGYYQQKINELDREIQVEKLSAQDSLSLEGRCGFVIFTTKSAAKIAEQVIVDKGHPFKMVRYSGIDPSDIYWPNIDMSYTNFWVRSIEIGIAIFFMVFFWMIPIGIIAGVSNISSLSQLGAFQWVLRFIKENPVMLGFLEGVMTNVLLILAMIILIPILTKMSKVQGHFSRSDIDKSVFRKLFLFQIFNVFLGSSIVGSIFDSIATIINSPSSIISMLAASLPGQANQMINLTMLSACTAVMGISRIIPLMIRQSKLKKALTPREFYDISHIGGFPYYIFYSRNVLILQICLAYSTMTPFILLFGAWYFGVTYLFSKYNIVWVNTPNYQTGGRLYPSVFRRTIIGLLIYQLLMIGVFNLYKFYWGNLTAIAVIFTAIYGYYVDSLFLDKSRYGVLCTYDENEALLNQDHFHDQCMSLKEYTGKEYLPPFYSPLVQINNESIDLADIKSNAESFDYYPNTNPNGKDNGKGNNKNYNRLF